MKQVVFSGQLANGKDVLADMVCEKFNKLGDMGEWHRSAFAHAVKDIFQNAFGVDRAFVEKWKRVSEPPPGFLMNIRKSLQFIGDGFRGIQGDVWIEIALRDPRQIVISDGRYINEARATARKGGTNVVVWRPGFENDDPNKSESEILRIVKWCLDTEQNGPIDLKRQGNLPAPDGIECYHYFFRNIVPLDQLSDKVDRELIPFLRHRYKSSTTGGL